MPCFTSCPSYRRIANDSTSEPTHNQQTTTMDVKGSQVIIDGICDYCEKKQIKELLQEYMKRLVLEKPQDPISFLIKTIDENPFEITPESESK
jgi:hypothetical protein